MSRGERMLEELENFFLREGLRGALAGLGSLAWPGLGLALNLGLLWLAWPNLGLDCGGVRGVGGLLLVGTVAGYLGLGWLHGRRLVRRGLARAALRRLAGRRVAAWLRGRPGPVGVGWVAGLASLDCVGFLLAWLR